MDIKRIVQGIDAFIAADKTLVLTGSAPQWHRGRDQDAKRLKIPIELNGELSGHYMHVDVFPEHPSLKFCLGLLVEDRMVDRLDFDLQDIHTNGFSKAVPEVVHGPHWHAWELNRLTVKSKDRHWDLPLAQVYTESRKFDASLRWYCAERNIELGAHNIEMPPPEKLL